MTVALCDLDRVLTPAEEGYPVLLTKAPDLPARLFVRGTLDAGAVGLAIVGTRRPTPYGRRQARRLATQAARAGFPVVSGLARGIDSAAHAGAIEQPTGRTIAVLGTGIDNIYPPENKTLFDAIVAGRGAVVTELPFHTPPAREHFPRRNRIIAGLSLGVIVVEGEETSGALITARYAVDMDREVFAVPGSIDSPNARGPHRLIKQGAKLIESVEDVLDELKGIVDPLVKLKAPDERLRVPKPKQEISAPLLESAGVPPEGTKPAKQKDPRPDVTDLRAVKLNPREQKIFALLDTAESKGIDALIQASGLQAHEVLATLLVLEVRRLCRQLPGKRFVKA